MDEENVKEWWVFVLGNIDRIADAWVDFFVSSKYWAIFIGIILAWLLIALLSPIWVGPFLLWRKFRGGQLDEV